MRDCGKRNFAKKKRLPPIDKIRLFSLALCTVLLLGSLGEVGFELDEYHSAQSEYRTIARSAIETKPVVTPAPVQEVAVTEPTNSEGSPLTEEEKAVDFTTLASQNEDVIGWLSQNGTVIDYPIVQGSDNAYYLSHSFLKAESKAGCLFADVSCEADFSGRVTIIYGHDLLDGSMLSSLNRYESQSYFDEHPTLTLITPTETATVHIFSAFSTNPTESYQETSPWRTGFANDDDFAEWLAVQASRTQIQAEVTPSGQERILVLSTCTGSGGRFLVMGILE